MMRRKKKSGTSDDSSGELSFDTAQQSTPLLSDDRGASVESDREPAIEEEPQMIDDDGEEVSEKAEAEESDSPPTTGGDCGEDDANDSSCGGDDRPSEPHHLIRRAASSFLIPLTDQTGSPSNIVAGLFCLAFVGTLLGLVMPGDSSLPSPWYRTISSIVGYTYFVCWSVSFYPQVLLNYKRKSTVGLSNDFTVLNVAGFACYATYTCCFYWSSEIKEEYRRRNGEDAEITVQSNDVAFAVHAFVLCAVQTAQILMYGGLRSQPLGGAVKMGLGIGLAVVAVYAGLIVSGVGLGKGLLWLDFLYLLSFVKVAISVTKYIPQVILNIRRKSTVGWNIWNIILDFTGGVLSILQLIGDSADISDWSGITGNPAKFALGFVSIIFDIIFFTQHYFLYREHEHERSQSESLLDTYDTESLI